MVLQNRYVITVLNNRDIGQLIRDLVKVFSGLLRISVDAFYSTKSTATVYNYETGEPEVQTQTQIAYPNGWGSVTITEFIRHQKDLDDLCAELNPKDFGSKLLTNTYHTRDVFSESNVRVHRLLAFQIVIKQYPTAWLFK